MYLELLLLTIFWDAFRAFGTGGPSKLAQLAVVSTGRIAIHSMIKDSNPKETKFYIL